MLGEIAMLTIGQLAECTGVSEKALRFYENKGLIHSVRNKENNYRYYEEAEKETIEKIIMFKFLGFSLEEIKVFLENGKEMSMEESLKQQRWFLEQERKKLDTIIYCIDRAIKECEVRNTNIDELLENMKAIKIDRSADVQIAELYRHSDKAEDWNVWVFEQAEVKENLEILDAGVGWGNLWRLNQEQIPLGCKIDCLDKHNTWADEFEVFVKEEVEKGNYKAETFSFLWGDMEEMQFLERYDRIFLNHVAYFLKDCKKMYERFRGILKEDGIFISTLGGVAYFEEVEELLLDFSEELGIGREKFVREVCDFGCMRKNRVFEQEKMLEEVFPKMEKRVFEIELVFNEKDCYEFLTRTYKDIKNELERHRQEFSDYLRRRREREGSIKIKKDTYLFYCKK